MYAPSILLSYERPLIAKQHGVPRIATTPVKTEAERDEELEKISKYQALVDLIHTKIEAGENTRGTLDLTSKLLTKNPEYYTIWNIRRRLLLAVSLQSSSSFKSSSAYSQSKFSPNSLPTDTSTAPSETLPSSSSTTHTHSTTTQLSRDGRETGQSGTTPEAPVARTYTKPNTENNDVILGAIKDDLVFLVPLLKKWPKCYWIWNHRIWLLQQSTLLLRTTIARKLWTEELGLCSMMLVRDSRNFHGWGYRKMVVEQLESEKLEGKSMVEEEFAYTTKMVHAHLSNFSAWHTRSKLIPRLLDERGATDGQRRDFIDEEFDMMRDALWTDGSDQSLWFYHQWLMLTLMCEDKDVTILPNFTREQRHMYAVKQIDDLKDMLDGAEDCKWIYHGLFEYTLAVCKLLDRQPTDEEKEVLRSWLSELKKLDPLRHGRWKAREIELNL